MSDIWRIPMELAYQEATKSVDPSTQTSAVIVGDNGNVIGIGHNHFPEGVDPRHWQDREAKYARVVHAEMAAIIDAGRKGLPAIGAIMVSPWAACSNCAKHIADSGIATLVRHRFVDNGVDETSPWYEDCVTGDDIMRSAGVQIIEIPALEGSWGIRRNGEIWR